MPFPVTIRGVPFALADFAGLEYYDGIPDSLEQLGNLAQAKQYTTSTTAAVTTATDNFFLATELAVDVGGGVLIVNRNTPTEISFGIVASYNRGTGELVVDDMTGGFSSSNWGIFVNHDSGLLPTGIYPGGHQAMSPELPQEWAGFADNYSTPFRFVQSALLEPWPSGGYKYFTDFADPMGTLNGSLGQWYLSSIGSGTVTITNGGHTDFTATTRGSQDQGMMKLSCTGVAKAAFTHSNKGYLSAYTCGDFFVGFAVNTMADLGSATKTMYVGLRGDASLVAGDIFSSYGIGFEIVMTGTTQTIYAVVCINGTRQKQQIAVGITGYPQLQLFIFGCKLTNKVFFRYTTSTGQMVIPFDTSNYQAELSMAGWPASRAALLHPAFSLDSKESGTFSCYPERAYVYKQLER